jgi:NTP pyrophosphatase (non-canonical NTP hydrolase)
MRRLPRRDIETEAEPMRKCDGACNCPDCEEELRKSRAFHEEQALYGQAWIKWKELQYLMFFEEFAELQKELVKKLRGKGDGDKIREEIADCLIMLEQLMVMFGRDKVLEQKQKKIQRLKEMLA